MGQFVWFFSPSQMRHDGVVIGAHALINRDCCLDARGPLRIGRNASISPYVTILTTQHVMEAVSSQTMSPKYMDDALRGLNDATGMNPADRTALRNMLTEIGKWNQRQQANPAGATMLCNRPYRTRSCRYGTPLLHPTIRIC